MLLVAPDFTHQENCIENDAGNDGTEEDDAKENLNAFAPVENDPATAHGHRERGQAHTQGQEESHCLTATGDAHRPTKILARAGKKTTLFAGTGVQRERRWI